MICPECEKSGLKSKVYPGGSFTTAAYYRPFYDEDGKHHLHDLNTTTTSYLCSNGHHWKETSRSSCWCGWPSEGGAP